MLSAALQIVTVILCGFIVRCFFVDQASGGQQQMRRWPVDAVVARLPVLGLPCCFALVESMLRTCLWFVLLRGCALGDVAATGTCILRMLALHGSTAASCRAFSMLVMLGLDARSFSLEGKVLLCAVVAVAPIFPPKKKSTDYMREWREYRAQHGSVPVETPNSAGYLLAISIRKARERGVFNAAEFAELHSPVPAPAASQVKAAGAVAPAPRVAQPRSAPLRATPAGSAFCSALGGSSSSSGVRSSSDTARPFDPLIVEATQPQVPDPQIYGGELVLDDPPPSSSKIEIELTSSATGKEGEEASAATGRVVGGSTTSGAALSATLSLPGLNINWPFSQLILAGVKTVETRSYALGFRNIAQPDVEMWLVETPAQKDAISKGWVLAGGAAMASRPEKAQIVGTLTFSRSDKYESLAAFRTDKRNHRIAKGGHYDWDGKGERHAWRVSAVRRLAQPVPQPGPKGTTGFTKNRAYTVSFAETASTGAPLGGEGASATETSGREGHRASTGKCSTPASQGSATIAAAPKTRKLSNVPEVRHLEGLFFEPQQGAWCGMHALNNYCLKGRLVQQQDCRDAASLVARRLTDARAGDVEPISNHLDPLTGWLSIDVINVLGQANLGLHVEAARVSWPDALRRLQDGAALVNWNQRHWTVLQRDPSGDGWMHTNSIQGVAPRYGRRRRLSDEAVEEVLEDIRRDAGDVALHAITCAVGAEGRQYLEREGWRALAPAESEEVSGDAGARAEAESDALSLVTLNVDGLGHYEDSFDVRMDAILTRVLLVEPDVLVLQEVTAPMLTQLRRRLPEWKVCRRSKVSEDYFNVTVMRHGSERTTSFPFPASTNGRHLITTRRSGWTILNTHAESGSRPVERDARESQLLHMSRSHELEEHGQLCVLAGDFNLRLGEERDLQREGWRDAWSSPPGVDDWTWRRGSSTARYDRVFLHDAGDGESAECPQIRRLTEVWPALSDHVALHAVVRRRSKVHNVPAEVSSPATRQAALASSSTATGQAARTLRQSASAHASQAPAAHAGTVPVVTIGNAIVQCAKAVQDAGLLGVEEAGNAGELPNWNEVPKECGFKIERPGGRGHQHNATQQEKTAQCEEYGRYKNWALKACGLAEEEVKEYFTKAAGLQNKMFGRGDLPAAFRRWHNKDNGTRLRARDHAVLLCRVAGLRKAASGGEVVGLGGREEMDRLLALDGDGLQAECRAIPAHLRKAGSFALEGACVKDPDARVAAVVGLFQAWVFNAGARSLGAEAAWQELLRPQQPLDADGKPASSFPLDDSVFSATEALRAFAERSSPDVCIDTGKLIQRGRSRVIGAWWSLVWRQACAEVRGRFSPERRCMAISRAPSSATGHSCSANGKQLQRRLQALLANEDYLGAAAVKEQMCALAPPKVEGANGDEKSAATFVFSMEELYRKLFQAEESPERERQLNALYKECSRYVRHTQPTSLSKECGRLRVRHASTAVGSFDFRTRQVLWKYAAMAWADGWPRAHAAAESEDDEEEAPNIAPLPKEAVKDQGDGRYKFRSHKVQAASLEEAWRLLDDAYQEEQEQTARVQRMAKREKRRAARSIEGDALQRPGNLQELRPPGAAYAEVFRGRFAEDEQRVTFIEEGTWIRVVVEKDALRNNKHKRACDKELEEKLYLALRAEHAKAKHRRQAEKKKQLQAEQLPKRARDLEVKKKEDTGHLRYAYNGFEVLVTPRRHREKREAEGREGRAAWRDRELTPDRALRKLRDKIKRSLNKAARGEHEAIIARAPPSGKEAASEVTAADACKAPALAQLHDPTTLEYLREYFEFLASHKLLHCQVCDEEWPVFDKTWPQTGVRTAGELAGVCETIKSAGFQADAKKTECCSRCAPPRSSYRRQYCEENLQHLGPRHPAISNLTWYETLLVARVHPVISIVTLLATGQLCFAGHVCNYFVKVFRWFRELPNLLRDKNWFLIKRRRSLQAPTSRTRQKKPTTANRARLEAALAELMKYMPNVYQGSYRSEDNLATFPHGAEVEMEEEECAPELRGQVHVERKLFAAWLDAGAHHCGNVLMFHASNMQREEMRGAFSGDTAFDFCYRSMYQKDLPKTDSPSMGSQDLANFILWLIEDNQLPNDLVSLIQEGAQEELAARHKTLQTDKDLEEMWVRWIKQRIHGELDCLRTALDLPEELDIFSSFPEGEQKPYSAEAEQEAQRLHASLGHEAERVPAEQERAEMFQDCWDEDYGAEGDDEAYEWDTDEWQIWYQEAATKHDSMQVPASTTGPEEEPQAAATGHEEPRATATGQRRKDDKPLLDPPEIDDETGPIRDTDEVAGWIPGAFPSIFQNETGDPHNFKLAKPDLVTWGPHVLRSRGWAAQAHMTFMYWWTNMCQRIKALGAKKWFVKDNPKATGYTAEDMKKMSVSMLSKKMVGYTQNIPGTRASKTRLRKIILAMVRQIEIETHREPHYLGDVPCLFGTLTSQRYHWDDVIRLIAEVEGIGEDYKTLSKSKRRELVNRYPLFVSWYCAVRLELTLKTLVVPIFGASNYVAVFEWSPTGGMVHMHYILWKHGAPRFDLRAEQLVQEARRLRKGGLLAAAQVQTVKIDDVMEFFARYVSEWNPNKNDAGEEKEDHVAEKVNRESVSHTAATSVEDMLRLLAEDREGERREHYMRMVRLEHMHDFHHPDPLGPPNPSQPCARLLKGTSNMWYCGNGYPKDMVCQPCDQSVAQDALRPDLWRCNLCRNCRVMNSHIPAASFGNQSNTDAQPIATKRQSEMYCCKYCAKHHKSLGARCALYDIVDNLTQKDLDGREKQGESWEDAKLGGQLHKAFMAEIGEEMCQAEVAHHANRIPEFFVSRRVKNVHLYRKLLALTCRKKPREEEAEYDGGEEWAWAESGGDRMHRASDIELYERRSHYWFWPEGTKPSPYLPWKETPEEQVQEASLFEFFHHVQYHGGRQPYFSWWDESGEEPSRLPVICLQPAVKLKENDGFARNAQWALLQNHPWKDRRERFLATDDNGEPLEREYVKQYFRDWVETEDCPWYLRQQYFQDNERPVRRVTTVTGLTDKKRPQATAQEGADAEDFDEDEKEGEEGAKYSDTEESESDEEPAPQATKLLRQLRGASRVEVVERWSEVERKSTVVKTRHNFYKQTKVTSLAQEEQSALPAGVLNTYEDTTDEEDFTGEQKEIAAEMQALRAAQQWVNQEGWDAAGETKAVDSSGADVDLRAPTDAEGSPLTWGDVQRQLAKGAGMASDESAQTTAVVKEEVLRDFALEKLDPTQRVFAERVLAWGRDLVSASTHNATVRDRRKLKRVPLLRSYLGGSAGSGKSTTLRTVLQHLRLLFQKEGVEATVELIAYTGVAAFNIGFGAKTACSAFRIFPNAAFKKELKGEQIRALEKQWESVVLLIVDEVSFIGRAFLHRMHCRLQQAKRAFFAERGLEPEKYHFGDISIILVGDLGQLEPIEDISICDDETTYATCPKPLWNLWGHAQAGRQLLQSFKEAIMLKRIHRSKDDLWWTESCLRLRDFVMTYEGDYEAWRQHDLDRGHLTAEQKKYFHTEAVWLCTRCEDVGSENGKKLAHKAQDEKLLVHRIHARHSTHRAAKRQPSAAFDGLRRVINLVRRCKVMITRNIAYKYGLANGTRGKLVGVVYPESAPVGSFPEALVVEVPEYSGPAFYPSEPKWVPILPTVSSKEGTRQTREQFPVVAGYAMTVNKAQGLTLKEGVVINLTSGKRFKAASKHGLPFVAFTRSESFAMTAFKNLPPWDDFQKGQDSDMLRMRQRFTEMLDRKHTETMRKYSQLRTAEDENEAYEMWRERREREPKRRKVEPQQHRMPCPACAAQGWMHA